MCPYCASGWHWECEDPEELPNGYYGCCCGSSTPTVQLGPGKRAPKANEDIRDQESTGRKRAAQLKPLSPGDVCEWAGLKFAGGGVVPIMGCNGREAKNRHHGPDKSTLNNDLDNLHAICTSCHNRWHTLNDEYYGERPGQGKPFVPIKGELKQHDPNTTATAEELLNNEMWWISKDRPKIKEMEQEL